MSARPSYRVAPPAATTAGRTMRALVQDRYGTSDVLRVSEVPRPVLRDGEVLVRVEAASVNARDWHIMRGEPRIARLMDRSIFGWRGPRVRVRGTDYAGVIEAVGSGAGEWAVGDRVFGEADATFAEHVAAPVAAMARIPDSTTFEHAAALPLAATTALECLRAADPAPGSRLLINGASGGVGTFVLQLARSMELETTAVCSARNAEQAAALGAHHVIDYADQDFTTPGNPYDVVIDLVGNRSLSDLRRSVALTGGLVLSGGGAPGEGRFVGPIGLLVRAQLSRARGGASVFTPTARPHREGLEELADLVVRGALTPVIDRIFGFDDAALRYMETQHARGKVVLSCSA
jgi:NADPH:quinone reductase-like Zn-dependent oxidoreductase